MGLPQIKGVVKPKQGSSGYKTKNSYWGFGQIKE